MTTHDGRAIIPMDQMIEGKRYHSTCVSGEFFTEGGKFFYVNGATGEFRHAVLPNESKRESWAYMVFEKRGGLL